VKGRAGSLILVIFAVGLAASAFQAWTLGREGWRREFRRQAEEMGAFVKGALASRSDLLIIERFKETMRLNDDVVWVLVQDPVGRVTFSNNAAEMGTILDSPRAKTAGDARETLMQQGPGGGQVEVDFPLGTSGVFRMAGAPRSVQKVEKWLLIGAGIGIIGLLLAAFLLSRSPEPAAPPAQEPEPAN
jgi:hypothetical protein